MNRAIKPKQSKPDAFLTNEQTKLLVDLAQDRLRGLAFELTRGSAITDIMIKSYIQGFMDRQMAESNHGNG